MPVAVPAQFIEQAPTYVVRDGHVHIDYGTFRLVLPVEVGMVAIGRYAGALEKWYGQRGKVVPLSLVAGS